MTLIDTARQLNKQLKLKKKVRAGRTLSLVRRIERTAPLKNRKVVCMTFDDGPSAVRPEPNRSNLNTGLTLTLLDILNAYHAKGTFNVIGTTESNYPDIIGKLHTPNWGGVRFDHYPDYGKDRLGGIINQADIAKKLLQSGHELSNHTCRHILFGPMRLIYGKRDYFFSLEDVVQDLAQLHKVVKEQLGFEMKFSRPPHYIDRIKGGYSSYDAYMLLGYNYLAASFDGGGWRPSSGDYNKDVHDMIAPLRAALSFDPSSLNGQIIFQKDGYNMSHQTPVVDALPKHLELLREEGYEVITASELLELSPFEDVPDTDPVFETAKALSKTGYCVAYRNNSFKPDKPLTVGELAMMITPPEIIRSYHSYRWGLGEYEAIPTAPIKGISPKHPYYSGAAYAVSKKLLGKENSININEPVDKRLFEAFLNKAVQGFDIKWSAASHSFLKRRDAAGALLGYIQNSK